MTQAEPSVGVLVLLGIMALPQVAQSGRVLEGVLAGRRRGWTWLADAGHRLGAVALAGLGLLGLFDML